MFEVQENVSEAAKVESEHERWERERREREERERENRRKQTVGELLDALAQKKTNPIGNWHDETADTLCQILDRARSYFANSEVCCGALVIAEAAIAHARGDYLYRGYGEQLAKYLVLFATELRAARGAGYFDLDTRVLLERITDLVPNDDDDDDRDGWEWPSSQGPLSYHHIKL